tara:strand:+ start:10169 stop:10597 length:429 start_codon:yes stop_codon:yes gene_type:complete
MTFYQYDYSKFPEVKIIFNSNQIMKANVDLFFSEWMRILNYKRNFYMIYDVTKVETAPMYFVYKLVSFIKKMKKMKPLYLQKSIILINDSKIMKFLLKTAMSLTKPAADMYVYWKNKYEVIQLDQINQLLLNNKNKFEYYSP